MALRKIFQDGDPILAKRCRVVEKFDEKLAILLDDMRETMLDADGVGLAGPQVGLLRRVAVVEVDDLYLELINPQIIDAEGEQIDTEGCLSVDSEYNCEVLRPKKITVRAQDRHGEWYEKTLEDLPARAVCHELDHLEGILFYTRKYEGKKGNK